MANVRQEFKITEQNILNEGVRQRGTFFRLTILPNLTSLSMILNTFTWSVVTHKTMVTTEPVSARVVLSKMDLNCLYGENYVNDIRIRIMRAG